MTDILIIEDDCEMGTLIRDFMINEGFTVKHCADAEKALGLLDRESFRIVLLDVMLPGMNGFETCAVIRERGRLPILMMSAQTDEDSKLLGYETGADDYIEKPFSIKVLTAKVRALIRREKAEDTEDETITACGIFLDSASRRAVKDGEELKLTAKEFELLQYLMQHTGEAVSKEKLFNAVWGADCFTESSTVSVHIRWLREKLENDPNSPEIIKTVWKVGYRFGDCT